jgi:uncharacterized protein
MKRIAFLSGTGLVSLHLIDVALVDVEPGAPLARHLPWLVATLAVAAAAALSYRRLTRGARAAVAGIFGVLAASDAAQHVIAVHSDTSLTGLLLVPAAALLLTAAVSEAWGVNRGRRAVAAWGRRLATGVGAVALLFLVVEPIALAVYTVHKPRRALGRPDLGAPYRDVWFRSTDGLRIHGWYVRGRNGAAIVVVHGSGGDARGPRRQVRMLVGAGYGVLDIDARGRGRSEGENESLGWHWDRDVRGAVSYLRAQGVTRIGAFGLSTGGEVVLQAAAEDTRIRAVVADGAQGRSSKENRLLHGVQKAVILGNLVPFELAYRALTLESPPPSLRGLVPRIAPRPLLLIATSAYERDLNRIYVRGSGGSVYEIPDAGHTRGLEQHPAEYTRRVVSTFDRALCRECR